MPSEKELPEPLVALSRHNAHRSTTTNGNTILPTIDPRISRGSTSQAESGHASPENQARQPAEARVHRVGPLEENVPRERPPDIEGVTPVSLLLSRQKVLEPEGPSS